MPFVVPSVRSLERHPLVGSGDCVDLIKAFIPRLASLSTRMWKAGERVIDTTNLRPGTAIATFVDGKYPQNTSGQHAAFFLAYAGKAIWVMDQWKNDHMKPHVSARLIHPKPPQAGRLSNSSEYYYVIEL